MIKLKNILEESNIGLWQWYKQQLPNWPDYVIKDLFYMKLKSITDLKDKKEHINSIKNRYPNIKWKFEKLSLTFDSFDKETRDAIEKRNGGKVNPNQVPNDKERHQTQSTLLQSRGVSKEPIIVIKNVDGYELWEGWHRTIQYLQHFPNGFVCPTWVGYV